MQESKDTKDVLKKALVELKKLKAERDARSEPIAIVGAGCRFPGGADSPDGFWRVLAQGVDAITEVPRDRWDLDAYFDPNPDAPGKMYTRGGGFIEHVDQFDARFFGISPREAALMDPQQRILLEVVWEALENAGIPAEQLAGTKTGVYVGLSTNDYFQLLTHHGTGTEHLGYMMTGVIPSIAAGRIAHTLHLQGPNVPVDTACSSSLVATHLATQALRAGQCDVALVGGVNVMLSPQTTIAFCRLHAMAPDARCKTFDARANGYVRSEGCGVVVLKRLSDALRDHDRIIAVVRGTATNHDGRSSGITVPNGAAQQAVIKSALADAGLSGLEIDYLEAHGTGTPLGDPVEIRAAASVYGAGRHAPLWVGSVKTNIGHLEAAAGVAALMKAALALEHELVPKHLHFEQPNPHLGLAELPLSVPTEGVPWKTNGHVRRAAVSAFGFSGSNAHAILEEAPAQADEIVVPSTFVLPLSAKSEASLGAMIDRWIALLDEIGADQERLVRVVTTAALRRQHHEHRIAVVGASASQLAEALRAKRTGARTGDVFTGKAASAQPLVAFVYSGQGTQWTRMGARLLESEPTFRDLFDAIDAAFARAGLSGLRAAVESTDPTKLARTAWAQPAIFATQVALTALWKERGIEPDAVVGHSIGEVAAAHVAGALALDDAARLVFHRARLMDQTTGGGEMWAVDLPASEVARFAPGISIACINGPRSTVIAGTHEELHRARQSLEPVTEQLTNLGVPYAFHSSQMDRITPEFAASIAGLSAQPAKLPFYSTVTGAKLDGAALDASYWVKNVRETVRFHAAIAALGEAGFDTFVEVGAHPALARHVELAAGEKARVAWSLRREKDEARELALNVARLHVAGLRVDWRGLYRGRVRPVALPAYAWDHKRHWAIDDAPAIARSQPTNPADWVSPLVGLVRPSALHDDAVFESTISARDPRFVRDHAMHGLVILPAAGFLELARGAASRALGVAVPHLSDVTIREPLVLEGDEARTIQTIVGRDGAVRVFSRARDQWTLHVSARAEASAIVPDDARIVDQASRATEALDVEARYAEAAAHGVGLGPSFHVLTALHRGEGVATAKLQLPEGVDDAGLYGIHPALLDGLLQTAFSALPPGHLRGRILLPVAVAEAWIDRAGRGVHEARFVLTGVDDAWFTGDASLVDDTGRAVALLRGLRFHVAESAALTRAARRVRGDVLFERTWITAPRASQLAELRTWLVAGTDDLGLRAALEARGHTVTSIPAIEGHTTHGFTDVVLLTDSVLSALALLRQRPKARVFVVTKGAVPFERRHVDARAAAIWGLGRTALLEVEDVELRMIDVRPGAAPALVDEVLAPGRDEEVVLAGETRLAARITRVRTPAVVKSVALRADGAHVVSGGLGALGLATADWLVSNGARFVALIARRRPTDAESDRIRELEATGARVLTVLADVADAPAVAAAIATIESELAPVASVIHAAGLLDDALFAETGVERISRVLAPKLAGAVALHEATRHRTLDFFVCFSSIAALFGSPGQASYSAANASLDAFAHELRAQGVRAFSVAWGPWSIGMGAGVKVERRGMSPLSPDQAFAILGELLAHGEHVSIAAASLVMPAFLSAFGRRRPASLELLAPEAPAAKASTAAIASQLAHVPPAERMPLAIELVTKEVRGILGLDAGEVIDPDADLIQLGMDSLMALELRDRLEAGLGRSLPQSATFENRSITPITKLVLGLLEDGAATEEVRPAIVPDVAKRHEPFPLSDVQGAYWLGRAYTFELGGTSCHYYGEFERTGLDVERLARSWDQLVARHEMLRAVIGEDATQRILRETPAWTMPIIDLRGRSAAECEASIVAVRDELSHQVFDSSKWPLFDLRVHVLDGGVTRIHFSFDLLILDVFSFVLILAEWRRLYDGEALPALTLSFRDYQVWEAAQHETAAYQRSLDHWRTRIQTMPPPPDLPLAKSPREVQRPRFTRRQMVLSSERWARLVARARQAGITPAMIVCAAYAEVLERWSKSKAFTLNLTLFNRRPVHPEVNQVVGDFTSLVLLEVDHTSKASLVERAKALQDRLRTDLAHNQVSAVRVLREWSKVRGRPVTAPVIFTSAIGLTEGAQSEADVADAWLGEVVHSVSQTPQVWLDHQVYERRGRLLLFWDCVDELFPAGMLDEMFEAYGRLLERMSSDDEAVWSTWPVDVLSERALAPRLAANATSAPIPSGLLHSALEVQAGLQPSAPAVITSKRTLTYAELERDASRIAAKLKSVGVARGDRVAIVMEKSTEQVASVLGVLAAGAAYVPIAPTQPDDRIRYIVENTGARAVLTDPSLAERAAWPEGVAVLGVAPTPFADQPAGHLAVEQAPTDLAYIIFTSGSTGRPKGVMIDHRGALNTCLDVNTRYRVKPGDHLFGISDLGFDLSVWDIFGAIAAGATLVLPDEAGTRDPSHWLELMKAHHVSVWSSVPALMMMLVEYVRGAEGAELPESLRLVMMSGDWIPLEAPTELWRLHPGVEVMSLGGATEASIWSNDFPITRIDPSWKSIPYGKPLVNQTFHVLDQHGLDAPTWVPGQLYIGGIGVALGYYGDPEKTAAKFVAHPRTGERLYFTGDLGRYYPDGNLEFLGREDLQVKIHGHRIELGEIESVLRDHPSLREAVVFPHEVRAGDRQLVGYVVVVDGEERPSVDALREHLAKKLPSHMVPRFFVFLDRLPLSSNGKVDRKALPAPDLGARKKKAPKNDLERRIHAVWARSLPAAEIGVDESFFDLGGDSQLAVRLMLELREALGREVPIRALFEAPTIEGIATKLGGVTDNVAGPVALQDHELYPHYGRRGIGQRLAALNTDKTYVRARGMRAWLRDEQGQEIEVLDMVGGYGSTILGHNHPELVALTRELLDREEPFHVQYTNNVAVGRLCKAISDRLEASTGTPFVITLASTGTEVIEAALKHAKMEYRVRAYMVDKASENVAAVIIDQERKGHARVSPTLFEEASARLGLKVGSLTELYAAIVAANDAMWDEEPIFIALEHAFHGLTTGSMSLTASKDFSEAFRWVGVRGEFIPQRPEALEALVEQKRRAVLSLGFDASGQVVVKERPWHQIAGLMLEPVQGEGGIRPLDRAFVAVVREVADRAEFPVIVDEIQCGMGRTGTFTAAEGIGLRGDYYTFSKSLGGGLSKVAAMAVTERRYQAEFGYLHGSTFAEDGVSANLALRTLEILERDRLMEAAAEKGRIFKAKLEGLKARHPTVIKDVRGQGLMLGIQIATQESSPSMVLRVVSQSDPEMFNQIIAGFLLNEKRLRIAPTKTRSTIRFLPNAYVTEEEMDRAVAAFDSVCELVEKVNVGRLLRHLVVPEGDPNDPITDWRPKYPAFRDDEPLPGEPRVAHIAHVEDDETLLTAEPSMAEIPADRRDALLWRLFKFTRPAIGQRLRLVTATGQAVHVSFLGLVITSSIFEQMMKSEDRQLVIDKIQESVDLAVKSGCDVVGFGGYTSIVTLNCTAVATPRIALTSGNAFTVVLAVEGAKKAAKERGLDLSRCTAAVVGGAGNIGSVAAKVMAEHCAKVVLIGRDKTDPRLRRVANQIFCNAEDALLVSPETGGLAASIRHTKPVQALLAAGKPMGGGNLYDALAAEGRVEEWVTITDDLRALADCDVIISATSSSGDVILPEHLSEKVQVICDVATPKDVSASVKTAWPHIRVLSGGLARVPGDQGVKLSGTHLPENHIYGCVGETALLGVEGHRAHFSFGDISTEQVEHIRRLAEKYGFVVGTVDRNS